MKGFVQDYDNGKVAYAGHCCNSIPTGASVFSLSFIAWLPPAAFNCSIAMAKDKQGVIVYYARNVHVVGGWDASCLLVLNRFTVLWCQYTVTKSTKPISTHLQDKPHTASNRLHCIFIKPHTYLLEPPAGLQLKVQRLR